MKINMKFGILFLFSLFLLEPVLADSTVYLAIVTLVNQNRVTTTQVTSLNSALTADKAMLNTEITQVSYAYQSQLTSTTSTTTSTNLNVRGRSLQTCNPCSGVSSGTYCWWNGRWRAACRRDRELTFHEPLDEAELSALSEEDRHRHLQVTDMCAEAKAKVVAALQADIAAGRITIPFSSFEHRCVYDIE
jgi:hypothetical protein